MDRRLLQLLIVEVYDFKKSKVRRQQSLSIDSELFHDPQFDVGESLI